MTRLRQSALHVPILHVNVRNLVSLFRAWISGRYRVVPWRTIVIFAVTVLYAIAPVDLIPDYIPFIGIIDDVAMVGFLWESLSRDVKRFLEWEKSGG